MLVIRGRLGRVVVSADITCSVIHAHACTLLTCIFQCCTNCEEEIIVPDKQKNADCTE